MEIWCDSPWFTILEALQTTVSVVCDPKRMLKCREMQLKSHFMDRNFETAKMARKK